MGIEIEKQICFRSQYTGDNFVRFSGAAEEFAKKQCELLSIFLLLEFEKESWGWGGGGGT